MKIRLGRLAAFVLVSLSSLLGLAARAGAQPSEELNGLPILGKQAETPNQAKNAGGSGYGVLYSFCSAVQGSDCTDGEFPASSLIQDAAGNLYGTTAEGGNVNSNCYGGSCGTVFKLDDTGHQTVLYAFCSNGGTCADGQQPDGGLIQDAAGNLYGTASGGGNSNPDCHLYGEPGFGCGVVFKVDRSGRETVLYSFCSAPNCTDGANPSAGLIQDAAGNLYGTTTIGGANFSAGYGYGGGTVFKLDPTGHETILHSFCSFANCADGWFPEAGLIRDAAGNLYGTTYEGGANCCGTVFEVDTAGHETVLYSFCSVGGTCWDGYFPVAGLVRDGAGNLYGTTSAGGIHNSLQGGGGTVFKLDGAGHHTVLYSFCEVGGRACADGGTPVAGLIRDGASNLYGTTLVGGARSRGTVFALDSTGHEAVLYSFCSQDGSDCEDGMSPSAGLIRDAAGNLYGTTLIGGANSRANNGSGGGTIFKLPTGSRKAIVTPTSSSSPAQVDQPVTFSVVVSGRGPTPTGSVRFDEGKTTLGIVALVNGQASLTTTFRKIGSFSIVVSYSGDQNFKSAYAGPLTHVIM